MSEGMYQQQILEHFRNPRNFRTLPSPAVQVHEANPLCGDEFDIFLRLENGMVVEVTFTGRGCAISTAAASLLTEKIRGLRSVEVLAMGEKQIRDILGVEVNPSRRTCATLALQGIQRAIQKAAPRP